MHPLAYTLEEAREERNENLGLLTWGFWRKSAMSIVQAGHFMIFFCARRDLPSRPLCLMRLLPAKAPSRQALQKLWAQGVVIGKFITFRQIRQLNSACSDGQAFNIKCFLVDEAKKENRPNLSTISPSLTYFSVGVWNFQLQTYLLRQAFFFYW